MASFTEAGLTVTSPKKPFVYITVKIMILTILFPKATFMATLGTAQIDATDCMYKWLQDIGLNTGPAAEYKQLLFEEGVSEDLLRRSSMDQLERIGITKYRHRDTIYHALELNAINLCENGGTCNLVMGESSYWCSCLEGFGGEKCQNVTSCGPTVCQNGGSCTLVGEAVQCHCTPGYYGDHCENDVCEDNPCVNGGTCSQTAQGYNCTCPPGYEGRNCETVWMNKENFQALADKVDFLEKLIVWIQNSSISISDEVQESLARTRGPRFFTKLANVGPAGAMQTQHFVIDNEDFIGILINDTAQPQLSGIAIYKYSQQSILLVQNIQAVGPTSFKQFKIGDDVFLVVVSVTSRGASGPNTDSKLYKWQPKEETFTFVQTFDAPGARDVEFIAVENRGKFLIFSCGTDGQGRMQETIVYLWVSTRKDFRYYQSLPTRGGDKIHSITTHHNHIFIAIASQSMSTVYGWNGTYFVLHQEFSNSRDLYPFQVGAHTFLTAVNEHDGTTVVYRLDDHSRQFVVHISVSVPGAVSAEYFSISSEHFLAFGRQRASSSSSQPTVSIYKMDGPQLLPFQDLAEASSVKSLNSFKLVSGCSVLAVSEGNSEKVTIYSWKNALNSSPCFYT